MDVTQTSCNSRNRKYRFSPKLIILHCWCLCLLLKGSLWVNIFEEWKKKQFVKSEKYLLKVVWVPVTHAGNCSKLSCGTFYVSNFWELPCTLAPASGGASDAIWAWFWSSFQWPLQPLLNDTCVWSWEVCATTSSLPANRRHRTVVQVMQTCGTNLPWS